MTCYMGISFYHDPASESLRTSVAQVFNERGEGMVVRGGPAVLDDQDKTPHLSPHDAEQLLTQAVEAFRREHRTSPARLVCHKSSYFSKAELDGCAATVKQLRLDAYDLLSLRPSHTRLYRSHSYPPLRGTAVIHIGRLLALHPRQRRFLPTVTQVFMRPARSTFSSTMPRPAKSGCSRSCSP